MRLVNPKHIFKICSTVFINKLNMSRDSYFRLRLEVGFLSTIITTNNTVSSNTESFEYSCSNLLIYNTSTEFCTMLLSFTYASKFGDFTSHCKFDDRFATRNIDTDKANCSHVDH